MSDDERNINVTVRKEGGCLAGCAGLIGILLILGLLSEVWHAIFG